MLWLVIVHHGRYSGRKITASLGNVTVRGEEQESTVCLSMRSITENIYCSQLSSVAILLQSELKCFTSYNTRKWLCFVSLCAIVFRSPPASHVSTCNGQWSSQLFCVHYKYCVHTQLPKCSMNYPPKIWLKILKKVTFRHWSLRSSNLRRDGECYTQKCLTKVLTKHSVQCLNWFHTTPNK
jgi:hypothetical protein